MSEVRRQVSMVRRRLQPPKQYLSYFQPSGACQDGQGESKGRKESKGRGKESPQEAQEANIHDCKFCSSAAKFCGRKSCTSMGQTVDCTCGADGLGPNRKGCKLKDNPEFSRRESSEKRPDCGAQI